MFEEKEYKGIKKESTGIGFENLLVNFDTFEKTPGDFKEVSKLTVASCNAKENS